MCVGGGRLEHPPPVVPETVLGEGGGGVVDRTLEKRSVDSCMVATRCQLNSFIISIRAGFTSWSGELTRKKRGKRFLSVRDGDALTYEICNSGAELTNTSMHVDTRPILHVHIYMYADIRQKYMITEKDEIHNIFKRDAP